MTMSDIAGTEDPLRARAIERLKEKKDFKAHLLAYFLVNLMLVGIWVTTGAGFFWPIFPILGWGIGIAFHARDVYGRPSPTEEEIEREMRSLRR